MDVDSLSLAPTTASKDASPLLVPDTHMPEGGDIDGLPLQKQRQDSRRSFSGQSMFCEMLEDPEPTMEQLEAYDCLSDPYSYQSRLAYGPVYSPMPQPSPRLTGDDHSPSLIPSLVRKLSRSAGTRRPKSSDGRLSYNGVLGRQYAWSPRLSSEHPGPVRRSASSDVTAHLAEASDDSPLRPSPTGRRISFAADREDVKRQMMEDDIRRSLDGFAIKRHSTPHIADLGPAGSVSSAAVDSPVNQRRLSFDALRQSINANASPTTLRVDKHIQPLPRSQSAGQKDQMLSPRGWFNRRGSSPLSASHGPSTTCVEDNDPPLEIMLSAKSNAPSTFVPAKGSGSLAQLPARPSPRRSLSASILTLGKIVANMSNRSSSHSRDVASPHGMLDSPSFKVNHVSRVSSESSLEQESPRNSLSLSRSRPSSPLVTQAPLLAPEVESSETVAPQKLADMRTLSPGRPPLRRQAKSDDSRLPRVSAHDDASLLSPLRGAGNARSASSSPLQSPNLASIEERGEAEDWLASLRGKPTVRRMSAADLFGLPAASKQYMPTAVAPLPAETRGPPRIPTPQVSPHKELGPLDFAKKPVANAQPIEIPAASGETDAGLSRGTPRSSLLSASRPTSPAGPVGVQPFPAMTSPISPSTATRFLPHVHRKTQSSPAMALAAELTAITSIGPSGGESNVLNASHAKFAAVLTTGAAKAAKSPTSPSRFGIKDKEEMRRLMQLAGIESTLEEEEFGSGGTSSPAAGDSGISILRLPKLSYDTSTSSETDMSMSLSQSGSASKIRETASSAPSAMTRSQLRPLSDGPLPRQPVFSKSGSASPNKLPRLVGKNCVFEDSPDLLGERDRFENAWTNMKRRAANVSVDSQASILSQSTVNDGETSPYEDPFQPTVSVW